MRYFHSDAVFNKIKDATPAEREESLEKVMNWLALTHDSMTDHGSGSYHLADGWSKSYPETTGYIIPTLLNFAEVSDKEKFRSIALAAADFLLGIQKPSGGWQGGRMSEGKPEIVFNTGQVIRGMIAAYLETSDEQYLHAAEKAAEWLCTVQHPEGYWKEHALMNEARVYDAFVDVPLISLSNLTNKEKYRTAALKNLEWIVGGKLHENGWFEDCDNTVKHNSRPILHTIAYTLDGLLESDEMLKDGRFLAAARLGADQLKDQLMNTGRLFGRYDRNWKGTEYFLCTGAAQMAIIWLRLYGLSGEETYLKAADRVLHLLLFVQQRTHRQRRDTVGAIPGSFPIWGRYEPFAFPNWASKFFADALMLRLQIKG
jgi:uncharacterized protein YyaL (SSP411 family)